MFGFPHPLRDGTLCLLQVAIVWLSKSLETPSSSGASLWLSSIPSWRSWDLNKRKQMVNIKNRPVDCLLLINVVPLLPATILQNSWDALGVHITSVLLSCILYWFSTEISAKYCLVPLRPCPLFWMFELHTLWNRVIFLLFHLALLWKEPWDRSHKKNSEENHVRASWSHTRHLSTHMVHPINDQQDHFCGCNQFFDVATQISCHAVSMGQWKGLVNLK